MEQEIVRNHRTWFSSIGIHRVAEDLFPDAWEFFQEQANELNVPGGHAWVQYAPVKGNVMFAASAGEQIVGIIYQEETSGSVVLIVDRVYFGGGTFLRLLQAMDVCLQLHTPEYELLLPNHHKYRGLALASGCKSIVACNHTLTASRIIKKDTYKKPVFIIS